ncbi:MAG: hypothetical protein ACRDFQ_07415 [Anaerolineales bacterium]
MQDNPFAAYYESERTYVPIGDAENDSMDQGNATEENAETISPDASPVVGEGNPVSEINRAPLDIDSKKRIGIHYFADTSHYSNSDIELWLPRLKGLGINWIVLRAPLDRSIPQEFISALIDSDIQPILHFQLPLDSQVSPDDLQSMFRAYANWGVRFAVLFDRPNLRVMWPAAGWTQRGLVTRFLDAFIPFAHSAFTAGLAPVFPPLEPGGDYWDTAFLRACLEGLMEKGEGMLLEEMALGAYAWTGNRSMVWGAGGPEAWPATLPYSTPEGSEDQRGFRIFDWYNAVSRASIGRELPIIIVAAGVQREKTKILDAQPADRAIRMAETLQRTPDANKNNTVPENVLACNLWLLSAPLEGTTGAYAWFKPTGGDTKIAEAWLTWRNGVASPQKSIDGVIGHAVASGSGDITFNSGSSSGNRPIRHYLLLPANGGWDFESIRAYVEQHQPTIGTSIQEALHAARVTLVGGLQAFSDDLLGILIAAGCTVDNLLSTSTSVQDHTRG